MVAKVTKLRTRKGREEAAKRAAALAADATKLDPANVEAPHEKWLLNRITSLTQVIGALLLEREEPRAVFSKEELVYINPAEVRITIVQRTLTTSDVVCELLTESSASPQDETNRVLGPTDG